MKIMVWKAATGVLATKQCKKYRHLAKKNTCGICDREAESNFHALIACNHMLEQYENLMRSVWPLQNNPLLIDTGHCRVDIKYSIRLQGAS